MDLATTYLGLRLPNPLIVGAGPLCDDLDTARSVAAWVTGALSPRVPLHFVRFHPDYKLRDTTRNLLMAGVPLGEVDKQATDAGALIPFRRYAALLMARNLISPSEALLAVA